MGDLVVLSRPKTPARPVVAGESAAILFFTGVRYYRFDQLDVPSAPVAVKRRRSTRAKPSNAKSRPLELHA